MSLEEEEERWKTTPYAQTYSDNRPPISTFSVNRILEYYYEKFPLHKDTKIPLALDLACGSGQLSEPLGDHCESVLALDISPEQLAVGRQRSTHSNVSYNICSVYEISRFLNTMEPAALVTVSIAAHYFDNRRFYDEVRKCLKPGGVLAQTIYGFTEFVGLPKEALSEHLEFYERIILSDVTNESVRQSMNHILTRYRNLNVLLEDFERRIYPFQLTYTYKSMCSYISSLTLKKEDEDALVEKFYRDFWQKYDVGDELIVKAEVVILFSRNMAS